MRKLPPTAAEDLLELVMRRYERASTLLTSNRPVEDWGKLLGDAAAVAAMLDRLLHHGHVLKCGPRSWRTKIGESLPTEAVVLAAVDLDQLAERRPPEAGLVRRRGAILASRPQAAGTHPMAQCLLGDDQPVQLGQLLGRECGAKVRVQLLDETQGPVPQVLGQPSIAGFTPAPRHQPGCALELVGGAEPASLARRHPDFIDGGSKIA
jgi:hypothetical protein